MRTINSKKQKDKPQVQVFKNSETNRQTGFAGRVTLYDSEIYVDTRDGTGYDMVLEKFKPLIYKFSMKYHFNGNSIEDTKQDIAVLILEGIPKYNPDKNTKLSTFIEMRVGRRLINEIRNKSRISRNATFLNVGAFSIECDCGFKFFAVLDGANTAGVTCKKCGKLVNESIQKTPLNMPEVNSSKLSPNRFYEDYFDSPNDFSRILDGESCIDKDVIFMHDMRKWLENEDPRVVKIIELYCFHDYSIKAASEAVGLSGAGGNMKLKELAKNRKVREILGR